MVLSRIALFAAAAGLAAGPALAAPSARKASLHASSGAEKYVVRKVDSANLWLEPPALPDLRAYTDAALEAKIPRKPAGRVDVRRMVGNPVLNEFIGGKSCRR